MQIDKPAEHKIFVILYFDFFKSSIFVIVLTCFRDAYKEFLKIACGSSDIRHMTILTFSLYKSEITLVKQLDEVLNHQTKLRTTSASNYTKLQLVVQVQ